MSTIWEIQEIEEIIKAALIKDLGQHKGEARYSCYTNAREYLLKNIFDEIGKQQPELTDHGPSHIKNVLQNAQDLLGPCIGNLNSLTNEYENGKLNGMELYILGLSILFHDVGNIFKREEHQKQIGPIYDAARPPQGGSEDGQEKITILSICKAHCGDGLDGSENTLAFVDPHAKLERLPIRPNILAPILRFADELAEGEQRTSHYMVTKRNYSNNSLKYHQYALSKAVDIDRPNNRINLMYNITLTTDDCSNSSNGHHGPIISIKELKSFLEFAYERIEKLNQERQYAKHYCNFLEPFKETQATFNFWYKGQLLPLDISPIVFSDLIVPGAPQKKLAERDQHYIPDMLIDNIGNAIINLNG
ncbi:MAG: hypothetical protein HGB35_02130 [Geobacteraceae bacterium]|nr:hypothetical protein [Geobacteraceae bacterium]